MSWDNYIWGHRGNIAELLHVNAVIIIEWGMPEYANEIS